MVENPNFQITISKKMKPDVPVGSVTNEGIETGTKTVDPFINWGNKFMRVEKPGKTPEIPKIPY